MTKNKVVGPTDIAVPCFALNGIPFPIVADLPEGGFLQIVNGENPLGQAVPGVALPKGAMLAVITPDLAGQIRPGLKQLKTQGVFGGIGNGPAMPPQVPPAPGRPQ